MSWQEFLPHSTNSSEIVMRYPNNSNQKQPTKMHLVDNHQERNPRTRNNPSLSREINSKTKTQTARSTKVAIKERKMTKIKAKRSKEQHQQDKMELIRNQNLRKLIWKNWHKILPRKNKKHTYCGKRQELSRSQIKSLNFSQESCFSIRSSSHFALLDHQQTSV